MHHPTRTTISRQPARITARRKQCDTFSFFNLLTSDALLDTVERLLPIHRERLYPPTETLSMFLAQALSADRSCQNIVNRSAIQRLAGGLPVGSTGTGAYSGSPVWPAVRYSVPLLVAIKARVVMSKRCCGQCRTASSPAISSLVMPISPPISSLEIWVYLLAYNLIRLMMAQSALLADITPRTISFKHCLQLWVLWVQQINTAADDQLAKLWLMMAQQRVGNRPGRTEPRAIKRRTKPFPLLTKSRALARQDVRRFGHPKKLN